MIKEPLVLGNIVETKEGAKFLGLAIPQDMANSVKTEFGELVSKLQKLLEESKEKATLLAEEFEGLVLEYSQKGYKLVTSLEVPTPHFLGYALCPATNCRYLK